MDGFKQVETRLMLDKAEPISTRTSVRTPDDAVLALSDYLKDKDREYCIIVNMDSQMHPINFHILTKGGIDSAIVPMEKVFQSAVLSNASTVMMIHNHPSGSVMPSAHDLEVTERLVKAGQIMNIPVCDHIIIGGETGNYCSIRETNSELFASQDEMLPFAHLNDPGRNRMNEIMERLKEGVKNVFTSDNYRDYLDTMAKFHRYSINNSLLIAMQKPDATLVAGYDAWKRKFGRQVRKGEKGIQILCPAPVKEKKEETVIDENGNEVTQETEVLTQRFRVGTVFDVSQTFGRDITTIAPKELVGKIAMYDDLINIITQISPVPVRYEDLKGAAKGYYSPQYKEIVIQEGMEELQTLKTLIHESTHASLHDRDEMESSREAKDRQTEEVEAESVAYCVSSALGLDTGDYSFPYIAGWSEGKDTSILQASLSTIRTASDGFISQIEEKLQSIDRFEIYQISEKGALAPYQFMSYSEIQGQGISADDYNRVYVGKLDGQDTEKIFEVFNTDIPQDFTGHSLSVSDVVVLHHDGSDEAWYVDTFGFQKIDDFKKIKEREQEYAKQTEKEEEKNMEKARPFRR